MDSRAFRARMTQKQIHPRADRFFNDRFGEQARAALECLAFAPMVGHAIAVRSAANYRNLRRQGRTVRKTIDVPIATFCIENDRTLLHNDRDFDAMVVGLGLRVV